MLARAVWLAAILAAAVTALYPIWGYAFPPLLDYPNHLASTYVLAHLHDTSMPFHLWYGERWGLFPYLAWDVMVRAAQFFLPVETAGRVCLSLGVLGLPLASWFFLRQANPGNGSLALWALVGTHNIFLLLGYLNFYLSLTVCFLALGLWLRWLERPHLVAWFWAAGAFLALYFSHFVTYCGIAIAVAAYCAFTRKRWRQWLGTCALFVPGAICYLLSGRAMLKGRVGFTFLGFDDKLDNLWGIMHGYSRRLDWITLIALALVFVAGWWKNAEFRWNGPWLGVGVALFAAYWALPWAYGEGSDLDVRMLPILYGVIFACARVGKRGLWLAPIALALFFARAGNVMENYRAMQPELEGLAGSFSVTPMNARVLPLIEAEQGSDALHHPFAHFWAYGVIRRHWFSAYLFDIPGVTLLKVEQQAYTMDGFWDLEYTETPDWEAMRTDYDYAWAYNTPQYDAGFKSLGELAYASGKLKLYRIHTRGEDSSDSVTAQAAPGGRGTRAPPVPIPQ